MLVDSARMQRFAEPFTPYHMHNHAFNVDELQPRKVRVLVLSL